MRILFLYPNKVMATRMPLGIGYLYSYLKKNGHDAEVFDTTFFKCGNIQNDEELRASSLQVRNPDFKKYNLIEKNVDIVAELERKIQSFKPDMIAMSVTDPNYNFGLELLKKIKNKYSNIITVVGGATVTFSPEEVIAEDCVDIICIGEGEEAMSELCNAIQQGKDIKNIKNMWVKENGKIYKNDVRQLRDVNEIFHPNWDIFDERHLLRPLGGKMYRMGIFYMTRGCPFRCTYCGNFALSRMYEHKGSLYRVKKPDFLIQELVFYKKKYNLNFIFFTDDLFPLHKPEIIDDFCRLYKKQVGLPFSVALRPELITEKDFAKIVDAGCRNICVGLESGNPGIRKDVLGRGYKNDDLIRVFGFARKYKIRSSAFNMIGIPHETRENIFESIELNRKAKPTSTTLTFLHPYRGTGLRSLCIKEKFFDPSREKEYENVYRVESCLNLPTISNKELRGLFKTFQLYFKLPKIFYPLIRIAEGDSFLAKVIFYMLKRMFYYITDKESKWDFTASGQKEQEKERKDCEEHKVFI
ncbi:MAG: radical SAM protein [Candidatus Omnitrophota bacterium]